MISSHCFFCSGVNLPMPFSLALLVDFGNLLRCFLHLFPVESATLHRPCAFQHFRGVFLRVFLDGLDLTDLAFA